MLPVLIALRNIPATSTLKTTLQKKAQKLSLYCQHIHRCRILVTLQQHQRQGHLYQVHIELSVPGTQLAAKNRPVENLQTAIQQAFEALRRQLEHHGKKRNHHTSRIHHHIGLLPSEKQTA